jgi:hypothetical protein
MMNFSHRCCAVLSHKILRECRTYVTRQKNAVSTFVLTTKAHRQRTMQISNVIYILDHMNTMYNTIMPNGVQNLGEIFKSHNF